MLFRSAHNPSDCVPDDIFELSKDQEDPSDKITDECLEKFSIFQVNYDFDHENFYEFSLIPEEYLGIPTEREIYKFCKKIIVSSGMKKEIVIMALIYVEKLMMKTGLLMNELNWRRFIFTSLLISSKVFYS